MGFHHRGRRRSAPCTSDEAKHVAIHRSFNNFKQKENKFLNTFFVWVTVEGLLKFAATTCKSEERAARHIQPCQGCPQRLRNCFTFNEVPFDNGNLDRLTLQAEVVYAICDCTVMGY